MIVIDKCTGHQMFNAFSEGLREIVILYGQLESFESKRW